MFKSRIHRSDSHMLYLHLLVLFCCLYLGFSYSYIPKRSVGLAPMSISNYTSVDKIFFVIMANSLKDCKEPTTQGKPKRKTEDLYIRPFETTPSLENHEKKAEHGGKSRR